MKNRKAQPYYRTLAVITARLRFTAPFCLLSICFLLAGLTSSAQYTGGSYIGGVLIQSSCPVRAPLPDTGKVAYTGGPHSGFSSGSVSCPVASTETLTDIYTGGAHDGFSLGSISCPVTGDNLLTNVYTGGSHSGEATLAISCSVAGTSILTNIYTGGAHNGDASGAVSCPLSGPVTLTNIYTGGSHNGFIQSAANCLPPAPLPDTGRVAFTGGPHSGFASAAVACPVTGSSTLTNIYKGASHEGFGVASISCLATVAATLTNIFKGASYEGFAMADISCPTSTGPDALTNIYMGGPHNGFDMTYISCPTEPLFKDSISVQNVLCNSQCNGTASSYPADGTAPYTYYWNTNPAQTTQTATGLCAGTYSVTVTDAAYNTATATFNITQPLPLSVHVIVINTACDSSTGKATANTTGGTPPYSYNWNTNPLQTTQQATGLAAGNYTITVSDSSQCSATATGVISGTGGNLIASVSISASSDTICTGTSVIFTAIPGNGGSTPFYQWKVNSTNSGTNSSSFSDDSLNNNDLVTCVMTSDAGCVTGSPATSNPITITVTQNARAGTIVPDRDTVCEGSSGHLTDAGATGNVQWQSSSSATNFSDIPGANSTLYTTPVLTQATYYRVYLTGGTCSDTSSVVELMVSPAPQPPVLTTTDTIICPGDSTLLCAPNTYASYLWTTGATVPCIYASQAEAYWVSVSTSGGCSTTSNHLNIAAYAAPAVSISQHGDTLIASYAASYQWYSGGVLIPGATNTIFIALQSGNYTVQVADTNGCVALSKNFPYTAVGLREVGDTDQFEIYPNPATAGSFNIRYSGAMNKIYHLNILDAIGEEVAQESLNFTTIKTIPVNISQLPKGVYLLQLEWGGQIVMRKIVVQ